MVNEKFQLTVEENCNEAWLWAKSEVLPNKTYLKGIGIKVNIYQLIRIKQRGSTM